MEDKPIRVLMLFTILNRGGAETMVINYLRRIDRSKVIFDFIVHRSEKGAYDDEVEKNGMQDIQISSSEIITYTII